MVIMPDRQLQREMLSEEVTEQDELDVSNLLVTKSERAPATESSPPVSVGSARRTENVKTALIGAAATLVVFGLLRLVFGPTRH